MAVAAHQLGIMRHCRSVAVGCENRVPFAAGACGSPGSRGLSGDLAVPGGVEGAQLCWARRLSSPTAYRSFEAVNKIGAGAPCPEAS
jgi:hypothetical protein